jgi:hypothetical protein
MNFKRLINKLLENKNFYYVILALTLLHLVIYAYRGYYKSISFLVLSAIIIYNFNKNPVVVLLLSLIATHFFVAGGNVYEGLENKENEKIKNEENIDKLKSTDPELANVATKVSEGSINQDNVEKIADAKKNISSKVKDVNNPDMSETTTTTTTTEEPVPESFEGGKKGTVRLDHAATIETAYDDLQNILGNDGISKLTDDTKKLMSQQKNLFNAMNELAPAVKETMSMLEGLDLNGISNMSSSTSKVADQLKNLMGKNNVKASNDKS